MTELKYIITDELGMHARPAARLVKETLNFECDIKIGSPTEMVDAKCIIEIMGLRMKYGDELTMTFDGEDELTAKTAVENFLKKNF